MVRGVLQILHINLLKLCSRTGHFFKKNHKFHDPLSAAGLNHYSLPGGSSLSFSGVHSISSEKRRQELGSTVPSGKPFDFRSYSDIYEKPPDYESGSAVRK